MEFPFFVISDKNGAEAIKSHAAFCHDIIFSRQWQIFSDDVLNKPRGGSINKHASLNRLTSHINKGEILMQAAVDIAPDDTVFSLYKCHFELLPDMESDLIGKYEDGDIEREFVHRGGKGKCFVYLPWKDVKILRNEVGRENL